MSKKVEDVEVKAKTVVDEESRRRTSAKYAYNRGKIRHAKQVDFHSDSGRSRWVFGGNRTGKTECGAMEAVWWATGTHPYRAIEGATEGWIVSLSLQVQRDVAQAKLLKYLPPEFIVDIVMRSGSRDNPANGVIDFVAVRNRFGTTSKIGFKSCDQGREKFQGTGLDWVWFDEEPPEDVYEECLLRTMDKGGSVWGTMTPLKGRTWVFERVFLKSPPHSVFEISWEDNPFLKKDEMQRMETELSSDALESRKFGRFMEGMGIVFNELSDDNIINPFTALWDEIIIAIDPGFKNPTGVVWVGKVGESYYVFDDYSVARQHVPFHAEAILRKCMGLGEYTVLIDTSANTEDLGSKKTVAEQFREAGLNVQTNITKDVYDGINKMKSLLLNALGDRRLFIFKNCVNLIRELKSYYWGDNGKPVKSNDHCIDALRYALMYDSDSFRRKVRTAMSENKKQFIRRNKF